MFKDWEKNTETYLNLKNHIESIFLYLIKDSLPYFTVPFFKNAYGSGVEIMDGNPIFSAKFEKKPAIIKIIIDDNFESEQYFDSFFDTTRLFTIITPVTKIDGLENLMKSWLCELDS